MNFFDSTNVLGTASVLVPRYDFTLVTLSYLIAALGAFAAIDLAERVRQFRNDPPVAWAWLAGGSVCMGVSTWTMHFIAMIAYRLPVSVSYAIVPTLLSLLVAIASSWIALVIVTRPSPSRRALLIGGTLMGTGVGAMHYIGMAAMRFDAILWYRPGAFVLSIANAVVCSIAALAIGFRPTRARLATKSFAAVVMGGAIAGMHYTGMYATVCIGRARSIRGGDTIETKILALSLVATALMLTGVALILSLQSKIQARALEHQNALLRQEIAQKREAEAALQAHRDNLQQLVEARTQELVDARDEATRANLAKSQFLANMSHEMRTPMHAILSFSKLGLRGALDPDQSRERLRKHFSRIDDSARRLLRLLNDLLDLAKLEAGRIEYDFARHDLRVVVDSLVGELAVVAQERQVRLTTTRPEHAMTAWCDVSRVEQVLRNLLANAIKFTHHGTVVDVRISRDWMPTSTNDYPTPAVLVEVADHGVGIPEGGLEHIFDKFFQSTRTRTGAGGTGLGLAIAQEIVSGHRGQIWARPRPGGGAIFSMRLPAEPAPRVADDGNS